MLSQRSSSGCKNRWAGLLRDGPSQRNYRGAVSSNGPYSEFRIMPRTAPSGFPKSILHQSLALGLAMR